MTGEAREPSGDEGPLSGISVLDASRVLAGPFCTMQLGDLGAEVVKVEQPGVGDQTRAWHPPTYGDSEESAYYLSVNRNKRSIELDLGTEAGRSVFRDLAREADVVVENFRVGRMDAWDLGYEALSAENPGLVYCAVTGYGEWGPDRERPAYDLVIQGEGGLMSITGEPDGEPVRVGVAITDLAAGLYATQAILAALFRREFGDGTGQKVDVGLVDGAVSLTTYMASFYFATGESPGRQGSRIPNIVPYGAYETRDGHAIVGVPSPNLWPRFCAALDREDLIDDERFATNRDRVENREALEALLADEIGAYETEAVVSRMVDHGVPATRINDMERVFDHPQVRARGMRQSVSHPTAGTVEMPGSPLNLSATPTTVRRHPPRLGEHTEEVLREHGYDADEIAQLRDEDVI